MFHTTKILAAIFLLAVVAIGQTVPEKDATEQAEQLRKEAVVFLRETLGDVNTMRSLENRISFTADIAGLMWFHDEREARAMYNGAIADFRDLLVRYDAQMNALGVTPDDSDGRGGFMNFMVEPTEKSRILRKFTTAMGVRQQIAMSIGEHDPDLAFSFYADSLLAISNPEFRKRADEGSTHFETQLLGQIAENNAAKAAQYAARTLAKGLTYQHVELLKKIYGKDPDKGAEFGAAILSRLKTEKLDNTDYYILQTLIDFGASTLEESKKRGGKRPVYSQSELRDIAELFAQAILSRSDNDGGNALSYVDTIQKYSPGRAAQIRAKFRQRGSNSNTSFYAMANAANAMTNTKVITDETYATSQANSNSDARYERERREREAREKQEKQLFEDVKKLGQRDLPKEEREKIIAQARKIIAQTQGRDKKVMALSLLASQVAKLGDKELAGEIMKDAEAFVSPSPKNYQDFLLSWLLASGYAASDPEKAFPILEDTISRTNETLAAFIKIGEFIDVAEEMIQDGEVQVGAFGGQMVRGLTSELGVADSTIQLLAKADFGKTKALTNRFDRTEIRVLAKMMVLRAVLDPKPTPKPEDLIEALPMSDSLDN